ncbi:MAG: ABC1 kinase family protein [Candidatus Promineifilaceae bacterium]
MTATIEERSTPIDRSRYRKILWFFSGVISNVIFWDLLLGHIFFMRGRVQHSRPERLRSMSRRFRQLAVEMGGVLIKLGQFLSARVDILPPEITDELAGLQDEVPPVPLEAIETVLSAELGDVTAHFSYFDPEPVAAASLGQAHRARLLQSYGRRRDGRGTPVVGKVQRPGIEHLVETDLAALRVLARWMMRYGPIRRRADVPALLDEFAATLWEELDYISEADNAELFGEMFADDPGILIPGVYRQHSTSRVLVLEDVDGIKITDVESISDQGINLTEVAIRVLDAYFRQIFMEGFFHADPHPGNLFVIPQGPDLDIWPEPGRPFVLAFVDFGMVGHIEELMGENLQLVLVSVTQRNARELTRAFDDLGFFLPSRDLDRITEALEVLLDHIWGRNLLELSQPDPEEIQELSREFRDLLYEFPFQVPQDFIYLGRAFGMLSGLSSLLDPTINPWNLVERYGLEIIRSRDRRDMNLTTLLEILRPYLAMPGQMQRVLSAAELGQLRVQAKPDPALLRRIDQIERRLGRPNWGALTAATILAGALLYVNDEQVLGLAAWILSLLFFLVMISRRG